MRTALSTLTVLALLLSASAAWAPSAEAQQWVTDDPRIRFGVDAGIGVAAFTTGGDPGGVVPLQARLGVQFNKLIGIYGLTGAYISGFNIDQPGEVFFGDWFTGGGVDFTFGSFFQVGGAFGVDYLLGDDVRNRAYPGAELRLAILLGTQGPGARGGIAIAIKQHFTILEADVGGSGLLSYTVATLGFELY